MSTLVPAGLVGAVVDPTTGAGTVELLTKILDRLDELTRKVERLEALAAQVPAALAVVTDAVDEGVGRAGAEGIDVDERLRGMLRLAEALSAPEVVTALTALAARADRLEPLLATVEQVPGMLATMVDGADELFRRAADDGLDLDRAVRHGVGAALRFGAMMGPEQLDSIDAMLNSGVLSPPAVAMVASLGRALASGAGVEVQEAGLWQLARSSRSPEVRRALGFLLRVAESFGRELAVSPTQKGGVA